MYRLKYPGTYTVFLLISLIYCYVSGTLPARAGTELSWDSVEKLINRRFPDVRHVSTDHLASLLSGQESERPVLIDAREREEYAVSHLYGARRARNSEEALKILHAYDKRRVIVVYCSVGYRSSALAEALQEKGFTRVFNLKGSIFKWANEGRSLYRGEQRVYAVHPYNETWGQLLDRRLRADRQE